MNLFSLKYYQRYCFYFICLFILFDCLIIYLIHQNQNQALRYDKEEKIDSLNRKVDYLIKEAKIYISQQYKLSKTFMELLKNASIQKIQNNDYLNRSGKRSTLSSLTKSKTTPVKNLNCPNHIKIPILIITCNRPAGLKRTLSQLIQQRVNLTYARPEQFPIYISQGCGHQPTATLINETSRDIVGTLDYQQNDDMMKTSLKNKRFLGYVKISDHYKVAINWLFQLSKPLNKTLELNPSKKFDSIIFDSNQASDRSSYDSVIIVEDDLDIAPDFYNYFHALSSVLRSDPSVFCVSSWNDNGKPNLIDTSAHQELYRTDFFPGLGWMMRRDFWEEIRKDWPSMLWDEYLREPYIRKNRQCIRPEISRTATFGRKGVSNGQFFDKHLRYLMLNNHPVDFCINDLSVLKNPRIYERKWLQLVYTRSVNITLERFIEDSDKHKTLGDYLRIEYQSTKQFSNMAKQLSLMDDLKSGVPRTAYQGVVTFYKNKSRIFLAPSRPWDGYTSNTQMPKNQHS